MLPRRVGSTRRDGTRHLLIRADLVVREMARGGGTVAPPEVVYRQRHRHRGAAIARGLHQRGTALHLLLSA